MEKLLINSLLDLGDTFNQGKQARQKAISLWVESEKQEKIARDSYKVVRKEKTKQLKQEQQRVKEEIDKLEEEIQKIRNNYCAENGHRYLPTGPYDDSFQSVNTTTCVLCGCGYVHNILDSISDNCYIIDRYIIPIECYKTKKYSTMDLTIEEILSRLENLYKIYYTINLLYPRICATMDHDYKNGKCQCCGDYNIRSSYTVKVHNQPSDKYLSKNDFGNFSLTLSEDEIPSVDILNEKKYLISSGDIEADIKNAVRYGHYIDTSQIPDYVCYEFIEEYSDTPHQKQNGPVLTKKLTPSRNTGNK